MDLDDFDRLLLAYVQEDAAATAEKLAEKVPLSSSAIQRRLRRLRDEGVIERQIAVLNPAFLRSTTTFLCSLYLHHERPEQVNALRQALLAEPAIQQVFYVTGDMDLVMVVTAPDVARYESLMAGFLEQHACIQRYATQVTLAVLKRGLAVQV